MLDLVQTLDSAIRRAALFRDLDQRLHTNVVDLSAAETGTATYKAVIDISDDFPNVGAMKTSSVTATVLPVED